MRTLALLGPILLGSCAFDAGHGFSTIEEATFSASFDPEPARTLPSGEVLTREGYVVTPLEFALRVGRLELEALASAPVGEPFDPAHPPPGYSLCHGGHCHSAGGRLVPYAEIEAELASGAARYEPVVTFAVERDLDLLLGPALPLEGSPSRELPETELRRARLLVEQVSVRVRVVGGALGSTVKELSYELPAAYEFDVAVDFPVNRDAPARVIVAAKLALGARLFDGVDFSGSASEAALALEENFVTTQLSFSIEESK